MSCSFPLREYETSWGSIWRDAQGLSRAGLSSSATLCLSSSLGSRRASSDSKPTRRETTQRGSIEQAGVPTTHICRNPTTTCCFVFSSLQTRGTAPQCTNTLLITWGYIDLMACTKTLLLRSPWSQAARATTHS
jgi:hypothetical protein